MHTSILSQKWPEKSVYALKYAAWGLALVPLHTPAAGGCSCGRKGCKAEGKHPRIREWQKQASKDPEQIKKWWTMWPEANVGIATGTVSGIIVLDIDGEEGKDTLRELEGKYGELPTTWRAITGGGGEHIFFKHPQQPIGNKVRILNENSGLDIRGDGGQVVVEPSLHRSGRLYQWDLEYHPEEVSLAEMPEWLLKLITDNGSKANPEKVLPEAVIEGGRNNTLFVLGSSLRAKGLSQGEILAALNVANQERCKPPLEPEEVERIVASVAKYEQGRILTFDHISPENWNEAENLKLLVDLRKNNPTAFLKIKEQLQKAKVRMKDFEEAVNQTARNLPKEPKALEKEELPEIYGEWQGKLQGTGYKISKAGCVCQTKRDRYDNEYLAPLANFLAFPIREERRDNGQEEELFFAIAGIGPGGKRLKEYRVGAGEFASMAWVAKAWGLEANIMPGQSIKDNLRYVIQYLGQYAEKRTVYTYTGWRKVDAQWVYLHAAGAIGGLNISVDLSEHRDLERYWLPGEIPDERQAVLTSLKFLEVAPEEVTFPLLAFTFLAPLCEPLRQAKCEPAFVLWLQGQSGKGKSTLAALVCNHFGDMGQGKSAPASFRDTSFAFEKKAFTIKDSVLWVDDFHPENTKEKAKMNNLAQYLARGYGDRVGRSRGQSDLTLRQSAPPRGLCLVTGEDLPEIGESGLARLLSVEVEKDESKKDLLLELQKENYLFRECMAGYIGYLAPKIEQIIGELKSTFETLRGNATFQGQHARLPEAVAWLYIGFGSFLEYALALGAIAEKERNDLADKAWVIFLELAEKHSQKITKDKPIEKFLSALEDMVAAGTVKLVNLDSDTSLGIRVDGVSVTCGDNPGENQEKIVGYYDDFYYYLIPGEVYKEVFQFYSKQGQSFPVSKERLFKDLDAAGMILTKPKGKDVTRTPQKRIGKSIKNLLHLRKEKVNFL